MSSLVNRYFYSLCEWRHAEIYCTCKKQETLPSPGDVDPVLHQNLYVRMWRPLPLTVSACRSFLTLYWYQCHIQCQLILISDLSSKIPLNSLSQKKKKNQIWAVTLNLGWRSAVWVLPSRRQRDLVCHQSALRHTHTHRNICTHKFKHTNTYTHDTHRPKHTQRWYLSWVFSAYPLSLCGLQTWGTCGQASIWGNLSKHGVRPPCVGALCWLFRQTCFPKARKKNTLRGEP